MFVHVNDAITQDNFLSVLISSVDTDVVVLAVNAAYGFNVKIFAAFGIGNSFCCIEALQLAQKPGPDKCVAILLFQSFTGCDTTSSFSGRGKLSAWTVWDFFDDVTRVFCVLCSANESREYSYRNASFGTICGVAIPQDR